MSENTFKASVMSMNGLAAIDAKLSTSKRSVDAAVSFLRSHNATVNDGDLQSPTVNAVMIAASQLYKSLATADSKMLEAAKYAGYIAASDVYMIMHDKDGHVYKSLNHLMSDLLPNLNKGTISRLIDAGRYVYIPALEGTLDERIAFLADVPPSSLKSLMPLLKDADKRDLLMEELSDYKAALDKNKGKVTARGLDSVVRNVRKSKGGDTDDTAQTGAGETQANIDAQLSGDLTAKAISLMFEATVIDGELRPCVTENYMPRFMDLLEKATKDGVTAQQFCKGIFDKCQKAVKTYNAESGKNV